ncbi:MAG: DUF459 domain-containing protein [Acidimicrobiales bacterium]
MLVRWPVVVANVVIAIAVLVPGTGSAYMHAGDVHAKPSVPSTLSSEFSGWRPTGAIEAGSLPFASAATRPGVPAGSTSSAAGSSPDFLGIACPASTICLATTSDGAIYRSNSDMQSWQAIATPTTQALYAIACWSVSDCIAVGTDGAMIATADGGSGWTSLSSKTSQQLSGIACTQSGMCVVVGANGTVLETANGGSSWTVGNLGQLTTFSAVYCFSNENCIVGGNSIYFMRTTDGGTTWTEVPNPSEEAMTGIACTSSTRCVATGLYGTIEATTNGGMSWRQQPLSTAQSLASVSCPSPDTCFAAGNYGTVLKSINGGSNWSYMTSPTSAAFSGIACTAAASCVIIGSPGTLLVTSDGGQSFQIVEGGQAADSAGKTRVMVIGGSVALALGFGLSAEAAQYGLSIADEALIGCGVVQGGPFEVMGKAWPANLEAPPCNGLPGFPQWETLYQAYVNQVNPQVVVLGLGRWETVNRMYDGQWMYLGEPAYDAYVKAQVTKAVEILASRGARIALLTSPYFDEQPPPPSGGTWPEDSPSRVQEFNQIISEVAGEFPGIVQVIDFGQHLSPGNQYAQYINGIQVRTSDGVHITLAGGEWVASWLLPQVAGIFESTYRALTPYRLCDTRNGNPSSLAGMYAQCNGRPLVGSIPYNVSTGTVGATGADHIPAGATSVVLNVTIIDPTSYGYLAIFPAGMARPLSSNINFAPGELVANQVVVEPGLGGQVTAYLSTGFANMTIDVEGYYAIPGASSSQGAAFNAVSPVRICDTRPASLSGVTDQCTGKPVAPHTSLALQIGGATGVPLTAVAVALGVTFAGGAAASGYLEVYPHSTARPMASQLNWRGNGPVTNSVYTTLPSGGVVDVYNGSDGYANVAVDLEGYFLTRQSETGNGSNAGAATGSYVSLAPTRICDTRPASVSGIQDACTGHSLPAGGMLTLDTASALDPPYPRSAVVLDITATSCTGSGYMSIYPAGTGRPIVSQVTFSYEYATSVEATIPLLSGSDVTIYSSRACQVVVDLAGFYAR